MLKVPDEIVIGHKHYKIKKVENLVHDEGAYGLINVRKDEIKYSPHAPHLHEVLVHELVHALHAWYGIDLDRPDEEQKTEAETNQLIQLLAANVKFFKWLVERIETKQNGQRPRNRGSRKTG